MAIRPAYSKLVLPSRKSLEIIINIKINKINKIIFFYTKNGGCPLIRACSLIRSNTVCKLDSLVTGADSFSSSNRAYPSAIQHRQTREAPSSS